MDYKELYEIDDFQRNMRRTPWTKLFPHWWSENDDLLNAIGDEVERIKAQAVFTLLNAGIKPPVLIWQESLVNKEYSIQKNITELPSTIDIRAPLYKTYGKITLTNNTEDDIDGIEITFDDDNGLAINELISQSDKITIDLYSNKVYLNNKQIKAQIIGQGMPYFITSQNNQDYHDDTPLHNEIIRLKINTDTNLENTSIISTINVTEDLHQWTVNGDAYQYNKGGADPWIALDSQAHISYTLDFTNIHQVVFWYQSPDNAQLRCYCGSEVIDKESNEIWSYYSIDTTNISGVNTLQFENISSTGTIYINDIKYTQENKYNIKCDIDVDVCMDNAVFINEQNIEVTSLELIPIERIELYAKYDFPYNSKYNGWRKVYQKKYDDQTNVIYDMITTHFFTKEFYVDVWFKTLQYPYRVGFPAYQDADFDSMYHVNNILDTWGEQLGLERRIYKKDIKEQDYYNTFPAYYPFDIEQDYWYYSRLINEYAWNENAINDVDIIDINGDNIVRLYSINPFCEDFVIHAKSLYPTETSLIEHNQYSPRLITQQNSADNNQQVAYNSIINLLQDNDNYASITLNNNTNNNDVIYKKRTERYRGIRQYTDDETLSSQEMQFLAKANQTDLRNSTNISKELITYFDLSDLPEDINIDNIEVIVEGDSTDNKTDKFANNNTGLLIPDLYSDENSFIPLTSTDTYQLKKKQIIYSNDEFIKYQNDIVYNTTNNEKIRQTAIIGAFTNKISDKIQIPFTLKENDEIVDDIEKVYIYFNNILKEATIVYNEHEQQCIECDIPVMSTYTQIVIVVKSINHSPFTTAIDIKKEAVYKNIDADNNKDVIIKTIQNDTTGASEIAYYYKNGDEEELITTDINIKSVFDYYNITGPIIDDIVTDAQISEEWRTNDLRNILQRQGIYFRHVLQNDNNQSSTSVFLYNIYLKIYYSPKTSSFSMSTHIDTKNRILPDVGTYEVTIKNTGTKPLLTSIDVFAPPNISLEQTNIPIYLLPGDTDTKPINIKANYPLIDGFYEILTTCEDKICRNSVQVFADGLIKTGIILKPHHGKYYENINLEADVYAVDGSKIHGGVNEVQFYINGYAVGTSVIVKDNKATTTIVPGDYSFTGTGVLKLEARFLGTNKYASSRGQSTIFIGKNSTRITIEAPEKAIYKGSYEARAKVEYYNGTQYIPVNDGAVEFYINDEILGLSNINDAETFKNGSFIIKVDSLDNPIGNYILYARYVGSNQYASIEESQNFEIIGGTVSVYGYDETIKPHDSVQLKAKLTDANKKNIPYGYVDFIINDINKTIMNIPVKNGIAISPEFIVDIDVDNNETKILDVIIQYHSAESDENNPYADSNNADNPSHIIISKSEVYFEYPSLYKGSQYEPLGFWLRVIDINTGQYINHGTVKITLPSQNNVSVTSTINDDGIARLIYNPITFSAKEWNALNKFKFTTANYDANLIDIVNDTNIPESNITYDSKNLYKIYDGNKIDIYDGQNNNIGLVNFTYENGELYIIGTGDNERVIKEHVFISEDGCLYSRTTFDDLRIYNTGLQDVYIEYTDPQGQYLSKAILLKDILNISQESVNLDIHSYDLTYTDKENITCYVNQYTHSFDMENYTENPQNLLIDTGSVEFLIDDIPLNTIPVASNGQAQFSHELFTLISAGPHLMRIRYLPDGATLPTTNSYAFITLRPLEPIISMEIDRKTKGRKSNIIVRIDNVDNNVPLNGIVNLYMNGEIIDTQYLYGNEMMPGIITPDENIIEVDNVNAFVNFIITLPDDIDVNEYVFDAEFLGNEFYAPAKTNNYLIVKQEPAPITLTIDDTIVNTENNIESIDVGLNEECVLDINVSVFTNNENKSLYDDVINEGQIVLYDGDDALLTQSVVNNHVQLQWTPTHSGDYILRYENGINYQHAENNDSAQNYKIIQINTIEPLDIITIPNDNYKSIQQALMCLKSGGTIVIDNKDPNQDTEIILTKNLNINKNCNIIGTNYAYITKDANDLVSNFDNIHIYNLENLNLNELYEIVDLDITNLNTTDFRLEDNELYYQKNGLKLLIYLANNNKFYTTTKLSLSNINSDININIAQDVNVHIKNIIFKSNDNTKNIDFIINNDGYLVINHSVLSSSVELRNTGTLIAQRNLMYCKCTGESDLNNNWWGSNTPPYDVENNIILKIETQNNPAVISEQVDVIGKLIGANNREYDLPPVNFVFTSDSGYFSIDNGTFNNNQIQTIYLDAEEEGNIYLTVDNQTVSHPIYDYERKTEVIIDNITEIPINYKVTINAKVQSCADTYYVFDKNNNITKNSKSINSGYITFYIKDDNDQYQQVGYSNVHNGKGTIDIFFTDSYYHINTPYTLKAVYHDDEYYFDSYANIDVNLIQDNPNTQTIYYVSSSDGSDINSGLYNAPLKTIQSAIQQNANIIYLLDGEYNETNIDIDNDITIKAFGNNVQFKNLNGDILFNISANKVLNIQKIDFIDNSFNYLFNNQGIVQAEQCIFYNNNAKIFNTNNINAQYCVFVDNTDICNAIAHKGDCFLYCWFGTNDPQSSIDNNIDNNIIMTTDKSKNYIYIGTVVHIIAELTHYKNGENIYNLDNALPLRIAKFATDYGSMKPITDYTYNNKSISLLNTNEDNNTIQYILTLPENKNYIKQQATISCYVKDVLGNNVTSSNNDINTLKMSIYNDTITINKIETIVNGVATTTIDKLPLGQYQIACSYEKNNQLYSVHGTCVVQKPEICVTDFNMDSKNAYHTYITAQLQDNFGNQITATNFDIEIDGNRIDSYFSTDSSIHTSLSYNMLQEGSHTLTIKNINNANYDDFIFNYTFIVKPQDTYIVFNYDKIEVKTNNNLLIEVYDEENNYVQEGSISIELNNQPIVTDAFLINGQYTIQNLNIQEIGQYNIAIYYSGYSGYYNESVNIHNIGVGIFNVMFGLQEGDNVYADIGYDFEFSTIVTDVSGQSVNQGYANLYIDNAKINETPIYINNGALIYKDTLPTNIVVGRHNFTIEYIDDMDIYLDTYQYNYLIIGKIPTDIIMNYIYGAPGELANISYNISTSYGYAKSGILTAIYDDNIIGQSFVTDGVNNNINITVPFVPATDDYSILFKYHDDDNIYADSITETKLIIQKNHVQIQPSHTWYYPNKTFHFGATFTNNDGAMINTGSASLYIDNVKETESIDIIHGQFSLPLILSQARTYPMTIVYEDNDYYQQTTYSFDFKVNNLNLNDITIISIENAQEDMLYIENDTLYSIPNQNIKAQLYYDTVDAYNVKDGIIDILIDDQIINSYYVAESNKYIEFYINNINKGEHTLTLQYHDSMLFDDFTKNYTLNIIAKKVNIEIVNTITDIDDNDNIISRKITTYANDDNILLNVHLDNQVNGLMKYYIGLPMYKANELGESYIWTYDYRFIGVQDINMQQDLEYQYLLPVNLLEYAEDKNETKYKLKAVFEGNNQYASSEDEVDLNIIKSQCSITFSDAEYHISYKGELIVDFNIDAQGEQLVEFKLNDNNIGSVITNNGQGRLKYQMHNSFIASPTPYLLSASFAGSAINMPSYADVYVYVSAATPIMDTSDKEAYKGGILILDNILTDIDGIVVDSGQLSYKIYDIDNREDVLLATDSYQPNKEARVQLPDTIINDNVILEVSYESDDNLKYSGFVEDINLQLKKNHVEFNISVPDDIYRGDTFTINIQAYSNTTSIPVDVNVRCQKMEDNI